MIPVSRNELAAAVHRLHADGDPADLDLLRAAPGLVVATLPPFGRGLPLVAVGDHLRAEILPEVITLHRIAHEPGGAFWAPSPLLAWMAAVHKRAPRWTLQLDRDDPVLLAAFRAVGGHVIEYVIEGDGGR